MHPKKERRQVNEKSFDSEEGIRDGIKGGRQDQDGWMHVAAFLTDLIIRHMSYDIVTANSLCDNK